MVQWLWRPHGQCPRAFPAVRVFNLYWAGMYAELQKFGQDRDRALRLDYLLEQRKAKLLGMRLRQCLEVARVLGYPRGWREEAFSPAREGLEGSLAGAPSRLGVGASP